MISKLINSIIGKFIKQKNVPNEITSKEKNDEGNDELLKKIQDYSLSILLGKSRAVNIIVIHCSSSDEHEILNFDDAELFFKEKRGKKIVYSNGYIPYHYLVTRDGEIHEAMPLSAPAIGIKGHLNDGISICYIGRPKSNEQTESILWLVSSIKNNLGVNIVINDNDNEYK